jgi:hypothetical protein
MPVRRSEAHGHSPVNAVLLALGRVKQGQAVSRGNGDKVIGLEGRGQTNHQFAYTGLPRRRKGARRHLRAAHLEITTGKRIDQTTA